MPSRQHIWRKRPTASELQPGSAFDFECREPGSKALAGTVQKVVQTAARGKRPSSQDGTAGAWELIEGEDLLNEKVLEQHRLCLQIGLLGQGTPEGYVDHEFPPQAKSIDGLEGPEVKKGQRALIDLIATTNLRAVEDDDEEPPPPDAPRCHCGRRSRINRVRVAGTVRGRPFFRCAGRTCRFLSFGDFDSSSQAQAITWVRFKTGKSVNNRHTVVGNEGYRPEDARFGPETESCGGCFVDALAALAERPPLIARILPNALPGDEGPSGCHEVRLCVDGNWQAVLIDERLPTLPPESDLPCTGGASGSRGAAITATGKNRGEELAFSRNPGNQIWLPLIEKAYAKAFGAYHFALPGVPLDEMLTDLTGAPVEILQINSERDAEPLWSRLSELVARGVLILCCARDRAGQACPPAHALLGIANTGDPALADVGLGTCRAVRLRNPRGGLHARMSSNEALAMLRGIPAEGSKVIDGSFWVKFPKDFLAAFGAIYVCHAQAAGGDLAHTRSFEGEFTPDQGLGVRGCALRVATHGAPAALDCWLSLVQPTPQGARLLRPAMGRVFNDLGILVLKAESRSAHALALGGAWRDVSCRVTLEPDQEYLVMPLSFRAWPGAVCLRAHAVDVLQVQRVAAVETYARDVWDAMLRAAATPATMPALLGGIRGTRRTTYLLPVAGAGPRALQEVEVILVELEGAALLAVRNPHRTCAVLVKCALEASHMAVHTSRGVQFGEFLRERNEALRMWASDAGLDSQSDWRHYAVEDVIPPASVQLLSVLLAVARPDWELELGNREGTAMQADAAGARPASHPFAPHPIDPTETRDVASRETQRDDDALNLAIQLSLAEVGPNADIPSREKGVRGGRWARHCRSAEVAKSDESVLHSEAAAHIFCEICRESGTTPAALACCPQRVCKACMRQWATMQVSELCSPELPCPACLRVVLDDELPLLLDLSLLQLIRDLKREQVAARAKRPPNEMELGLAAGQLARLDIKRCPACGTGTQKDVESCHKMICRACRAKFCFRCLARLEYFNCGCSGAEHRFVDPVDGRIIEHQ